MTAVLAVIDRVAILTEALETGASVYDDDDILTDALRTFLRDKPADMVIGQTQKFRASKAFRGFYELTPDQKGT